MFASLLFVCYSSVSVTVTLSCLNYDKENSKGEPNLDKVSFCSASWLVSLIYIN